MNGLRFKAAALLSVCLVAPCALSAQQVDLTDPFAIVGETGKVYEAGGVEAVHQYLEKAVRLGRNKGVLTPDWAVVFMMLSDSIRNTRENPAYALRIAEEGLSLARAGGAAWAQDAQILEVGRAYAFADLGRYEEAVEAATLALPAFRQQFGDEVADEFAGYAAGWAEGRAGAFNYSVEEAANRALKAAEEALDNADYGAAMTSGARAYLPPDTGIDPSRLRLITARAGLVTGRALFALGKEAEAQEALYAGAAQVAEAGWESTPDQNDGWLIPPEPSRETLADLFFWLGKVAASRGDLPVSRAALTRAQALTEDPRLRTVILFTRTMTQVTSGNGIEAAQELEATAQSARANGAEDQAVLALFYAQIARAIAAPAWQDVDAQSLIAATEAALAEAARGGAIDPDFLRGEAAAMLVGTEALGYALSYARAALAGTARKIAQSGDTAIGFEAGQQDLRDLAETFLAAAQRQDSTRPDANCYVEDDGFGCVVIVDRP
jgi:hypothetical protein